MKYLILLTVFMLSGAYYVHAQDLDTMNARYAKVLVDESEQTFEISKLCSPDQTWQLLEPLPDHVIFCGFEIKDAILYQNDLVCGGQLISEYRYTFKLNPKAPASIIFQLSSEGQRITTEITKVIIYNGEFTAEAFDNL